MVPPHGDPDLVRARPHLAPALGANLVDLDGQFGLHAGFSALADHWVAGRLAVVPAVGLAGATRSHFEAQDLLEQGGLAGDSGWGNRVLAKRTEPSAIAIGTTLPRALHGAAPALVVEPSGQIGVSRRAIARTAT